MDCEQNYFEEKQSSEWNSTSIDEPLSGISDVNKAAINSGGKFTSSQVQVKIKPLEQASAGLVIKPIKYFDTD